MRKVPVSKAKSFFELATDTTDAPTNANRTNLKRIGRANIAEDVHLQVVM